MKELPKTYNPKLVEDKIYQLWENSDYFNPDDLPAVARRAKAGLPEKRIKTFSISLPPPNVTGKLHIGHSAMLAYQDIMIRFHRMQGDKTLWLPGMDHAAIATQNAVERELKKEGKTRHDLGREKFLAKVNDFVAKSKDTIRKQLKAMGASLDWSREKFTLGEDLSRSVRVAFKRMYDDRLIYRGDRVVNWCPHCQSTLADDEVEYQEEKGKLYYIKYGPVTIATTRPETKLGDTGLAVHPDDKRYQKLIGKKLDVDLAGHKIKVKVFGDRAVNMEFGTGAIGVTPAHSLQDYQWAQKHDLEIIKVIDEQGKMTKAAGKYAGLDVLTARKRFSDDLEKAGQIEKIEDYTNNLSLCYRCNTPIEPLPSKQWFVDVNKKTSHGKSLKQLASEAVRSDQIKIIPERFTKTYFQWMDNLRDWCISRQIWYGHQIPVWYCGNEQKKMGFHEKVVPQLYQGKTKTYRLRDHGFSVGDRVAFENSQSEKIFGYGVIKNIEETTVGQIDLQDKAHRSTYDTVEELIAAFKKHHPDRKITPKTKAIIYTYKFSLDKPNKNGCGEIIVSVNKPNKCPNCKNSTLSQDPDTLDTWFSSSLWTFSTLGWPKKTDDLKNYHPTSVMETGYDILFFWIARMIIMSTYLLGEKPFDYVYLHGLVRTKEGKKMSKSDPETSVDPLDMIERFGADALRLSMIIGTSAGNDVRIYKEKIEGYRNFVNKLWNISRFILSAVKNPAYPKTAPRVKTLSDQWILEELEKTIEIVTKKIAGFEFSQAGEQLRYFTWDQLADWYLEIAKIEKNKDDILLWVLKRILILWHPFVPFVTEEIWQTAFAEENKLLMVEPWPEVQKDQTKAGQDFKKIQNVIIALRNFRAEYNIPPATIISISAKKNPLIEKEKKIIAKLARVKFSAVKKGIRLTIGQLDFTIPLGNLIDIEKERKRTGLELQTKKRYYESLNKKLTNRYFLQKAPREIVDREKTKKKELEEIIKKLTKKLKYL